MLIAVVAEGVAIALLALLVLGLLRSHALILKSLHDLGAGLDLEKAAATPSGPVHVELESGAVRAERSAAAVITAVEGRALDGHPVRHDLVAAPTPTLLAFLSSGCSVCATFWETFAGPVDPPGNARLVVVVKGPADEPVATIARLAGPGLEVVASDQAWAGFDIPGSPYFVLVDRGSVVGEGSATSWPQVRDLMAQALDEAADRAAAAQGLMPRGAADTPSRIDAELRAAGIEPGHASLHQPPDGEVVRS